jgi:hypothetical protein
LVCSVSQYLQIAAASRRNLLQICFHKLLYLAYTVILNLFWSDSWSRLRNKMLQSGNKQHNVHQVKNLYKKSNCTAFSEIKFPQIRIHKWRYKNSGNLGLFNVLHECTVRRLSQRTLVKWVRSDSLPGLRHGSVRGKKKLYWEMWIHKYEF